MATLEFDKIEETCGNVYLIDENLCLSNSYQIINKNFATLSASLVKLDSYGNSFNILYANFASNSAKWITSINNWETLSAKWISAETTVRQLSSNWQTTINLIYNKIINLQTYYADENFYKTTILNWLTTNFINYFPENQIINVNVYLSNPESFTWLFFREYYENCLPPNTGRSGNCAVSLPAHPCNEVVVSGAVQEGGRCTNATKYCTQSSATTVGGLNNIQCPVFGAKSISFNIPYSTTDLSLTRVISIKYIKGKTNIQLYT
jgi:hypothetical protein